MDPGGLAVAVSGLQSPSRYRVVGLCCECSMPSRNRAPWWVLFSPADTVDEKVWIAKYCSRNTDLAGMHVSIKSNGLRPRITTFFVVKCLLTGMKIP
jgi:hypothetical protein